jgi:hypothetical protein
MTITFFIIFVCILQIYDFITVKTNFCLTIYDFIPYFVKQNKNIFFQPKNQRSTQNIVPL